MTTLHMYKDQFPIQTSSENMLMVLTAAVSLELQ